MRERGLQRGAGGRRDRSEHAVREFATYSGANLLGSVFVCDDPQPFLRDPASSHRLGNSLKFKFVMAGRLLNITLPNSIKVSASMRKLERLAADSTLLDEEPLPASGEESHHEEG